MVIMDEISSIKTFFESHDVPLSLAWLEGCVNWCKEENLPANYTLKDLQHKVFEQWLLLDLRDIEVPSLPPDLSNKVKYVLNGNYSLQMMKVIDISRPKYAQLQKIRNSTSKNVEPENNSSKRVLQLTLTDGVQEVEAMEYTTISSLHLNLSPGIKIRLMGPITVRRGRLMLESKNVKVLGGEVEDLVVPNAAENVLAAILKLPLNKTPKVIEESLLTANREMFNETDTNRTIPQNQNNIRNNVNPRNVANETIRKNQQVRVNASNITSGIRNNINPPNIPSRNIVKDNQIRTNAFNNPSTSRTEHENEFLDPNQEEELRIAAEIDMLMEVERDFEEPQAKRKKDSRTPDLFEDADFNDSIFENIDIPPAVIKTVDSRNISQINPSVHDNFEMEDDIFENLDVDAHIEQVEKKLNPPQKPPVLTIEKLTKNMPNISNGKFKINAKFHSIAEKLTVADDEYHIAIKIEDETGDLTVKVHSDIVSDLSGYCPTAIMSLKAGVIENNTEAHRKVFEALKNLKEKLVQLNNIVEVHISGREKYPVIVNILK